MLSVSGLHTYYGAVHALKGVDIEVGKGEIVALIGANGAGKSTLLMTICGNPRPRHGAVTLQDQNIIGQIGRASCRDLPATRGSRR